MLFDGRKELSGRILLPDSASPPSYTRIQDYKGTDIGKFYQRLEFLEPIYHGLYIDVRGTNITNFIEFNNKKNILVRLVNPIEQNIKQILKLRANIYCKFSLKELING